MIAPQDPVIMKNVANLIPSPLLSNSDLHLMIDDLSEEVNGDYEYSIRKSIGELTLLASGNFCCPLVTFTNNVEPDQARPSDFFTILGRARPFRLGKVAINP